MSQKSFTMLELVIVISIIIFLSAIILPNYQTAASRFALERSAYKLAQDIRRAAEMAMSSKELPSGGIPQGGYGAHFRLSWQTSYKLYADSNGNEKYNDGEEVETINLEKGVIIKGISSILSSVNFKPPAPTVKIKSGTEELNNLTIILTLKSDLTKTRTVKVNKAGLIDVE